MGADQPVHWIIVAIVAALLFGGYKKMPEMARSAGRSLRIFKTEMKGMADDDDQRSAAAQAGAADGAAPVAYVAPVQPAVTAPLAADSTALVQSPAPAALAADPVVVQRPATPHVGTSSSVDPAVPTV